MHLRSGAVAVTLLIATLSFAAILPNRPVVAQNATAIEIGQTVSAERLHIVTEPGRYGLGPEIPGSRYAVIGKILVRIDAKTGVIQSIIREVDRIRD